MVGEYGPTMSGKVLSDALGYKNYDAFRQCVVRQTVPIPLFKIEKRRGRFALSTEVAKWLAQQRLGLQDHNEGGEK